MRNVSGLPARAVFRHQRLSWHLECHSFWLVLTAVLPVLHKAGKQNAQRKVPSALHCQHGSKYLQAPNGNRIRKKLTPEDWPNLKDLLLVSHDGHLLVELGRLRQAALSPHIIKLENRRASL